MDIFIIKNIMNKTDFEKMIRSVKYKKKFYELINYNHF